MPASAFSAAGSRLAVFFITSQSKDKIMAKASKIVLGKRPTSFKKDVSFAMLDGSKGCIEIEYAYRTRTEYAKFADEIQAASQAKADAEAARFKAAAAAGEALPEFRQADLVAHQVQITVESIMKSVKGWNLDISFDREAVEQLVDELPAAVAQILSDYREAITEGRLGN